MLVVLDGRGVIGWAGGDEPQPIERTKPEILDHDIRARAQPPRDAEPCLVLQIEADAALVAVEHREIARARSQQAARLIAAHRLHLDDVGAEIAEDHADRRAHYHVREFDDLDPRQRQRVCVHDPTPARHEALI